MSDCLYVFNIYDASRFTTRRDLRRVAIYDA